MENYENPKEFIKVVVGEDNFTTIKIDDNTLILDLILKVTNMYDLINSLRKTIKKEKIKILEFNFIKNDENLYLFYAKCVKNEIVDKIIKKERWLKYLLTVDPVTVDPVSYQMFESIVTFIKNN